MKKVISLLLVLVLCLSFAACGEKPAENSEEKPEEAAQTETQDGAVEGSSEGGSDSSTDADKNETKKPATSKSREDMAEFDVRAEGMSEDGCFIRPVRKDEDKEYKDLLDLFHEEVELLSKAESYELYFGDEIKNKEGELVKYDELLEDVKAEDRQIYEYCPIIAGGFEEGCGDVEAQMLFATPYDEDENVVVMIGIVTENADGTRSIEWYAFEGVGMELNSDNPEANGRIKVELTEEMVLKIQEMTALLCVISD